MIKNLTCLKTKTLLETINIINENTKGACFVVDEKEKLVGVITDGDIRRSILNNVNLESKVSEILSSDFVFGKKSCCPYHCDL